MGHFSNSLRTARFLSLHKVGAGSLYILAKVWLFSFALAGGDLAMRDRQKE